MKYEIESELTWNHFFQTPSQFRYLELLALVGLERCESRGIIASVSRAPHHVQHWHMRTALLGAFWSSGATSPWTLVQESSAHERFQVRRDKVEEHQSTTARRAGRQLQKLLIWEKGSPGNLLHMDHYGTATERARRRLARLDPIAKSDDEDEVVAPDEDDLRSEASATIDDEPGPAESPVALPDPYCAVPLDCPGYACELRVSVVACLFAAWSETRRVARRWAHSRGLRLWDPDGAEAGLHAWLRMSDGPAFAEDLRIALLSVRTPERRPHLANASVAFQPPEMAALGYTEPTMVLHWILSPELLPLVDSDIPVCSADRAWRFGCVPPCMLGAETSDSVSFPSEDCAVFCKLLGEARGDGAPSRHFRRLWGHDRRVHVIPCMRGDPFTLDELRWALDHPASLLSFHVEERSARTLRDRLDTLTPNTPSWPVLRGPADGDLILPAAWDTALTAKQDGLWRARRMHAYIASHGQHTPVDVLEELAKGVRAFFYAATPASTLGCGPPRFPRYRRVWLMCSQADTG